MKKAISIDDNLHKIIKEVSEKRMLTMKKTLNHLINDYLENDFKKKLIRDLFYKFLKEYEHKNDKKCLSILDSISKIIGES